MCTGSPAAARSVKRPKSFFAVVELGYSCFKVPRLDTISAAEYGLLMPFQRGESHHRLTAWTSASKRASSSSGEGALWSGRVVEEDIRVVSLNVALGVEQRSLGRGRNGGSRRSGKGILEDMIRRNCWSVGEVSKRV